MSVLLPFRSAHPLAVISIRANWIVQLFDAWTCNPLGAMQFADIGSTIWCVQNLRRDGWRILYGDGTRGVRRNVERARS